jgi:glycosyltransferase involved in cell wall biosynthesis
MATQSRPSLLQERSIPSVLRQTYQNWELLIRGDGTDISTGLVIKSFNDPRIKYKNLPRRLYANPRERWCCGGARAANAALEDVRGTYIAHLDDDDELLPHHLATLSKMLMSGEYDLVYGRVYFVSGRSWAVYGKPYDKTRLMSENIMAHCSVMYDRAKLGHLRYDTNGMEAADWRLWKKIVATGARVGYTQAIVAVHYVEPYRRLMESYAGYLDRLLPEGTSREGLRKLVTASLRVLTEEGLRAFYAKAFKRIKSK